MLTPVRISSDENSQWLVILTSRHRRGDQPAADLDPELPLYGTSGRLSAAGNAVSGALAAGRLRAGRS